MDPTETPEPPAEPPEEAPKPDNRVGYLERKLKDAEKRLAAVADAEKKRKDSELSEFESYKKKSEAAEAEAASLREQMKSDRIRFAFEREAGKFGAVDSEAAFKLADLSQVEIDDKGALIGADAVLAQLKSARPYLFGAPAPAARGSGGGNPPGGNSAHLEITTERLNTMSSAEFAKVAANPSGYRFK